MMTDYCENSEYCVLINYNVPEWAVQEVKNGNINKVLLPLMGVFHTEPLKRYISNPPLNTDWKLYKTGTRKQIDAWFLSEEPRELTRDIYYQHIKTELENIFRDYYEQLTPKVRFEIMQRDEFRCCLCGKSAKNGVVLEVDHKYPKSKGGKNSKSNLWTLCFECNRGKGAQIIDCIVENTEENE